MNIKSFVLGSVAGAISFLILGFLFYGLILMDFFEQHAGSATGVLKDPPNFIGLFLGELAFGALYTYIFLQGSNNHDVFSWSEGRHSDRIIAGNRL